MIHTYITLTAHHWHGVWNHGQFNCSINSLFSYFQKVPRMICNICWLIWWIAFSIWVGVCLEKFSRRVKDGLLYLLWWTNRTTDIFNFYIRITYMGYILTFKLNWPWRSRLINLPNNRDLNQFYACLPQFSVSSLNEWCVIAGTSSWLTDTHTEGRT